MPVTGKKLKNKDRTNDESLIVESPNKKVVLLKQGGEIVSEDEVLIQGEVRNAEVSACGS